MAEYRAMLHPKNAETNSPARAITEPCVNQGINTKIRAYICVTIC